MTPEKVLEKFYREMTPKQTAADMRNDFRKVFYGSEQGKRVLDQILSWGRTFKTCMNDDGRKHAFLEGQRNMALMIIATLETEPTPRPKEQKRK